MAEVIMYHKIGCPYCARAKSLLESKGVKIKEIEAASNAEVRTEMNRLSGRNTFPQIFIDGKHIGGCDDVHALDASGGLDKLLAA